MSGSPQSVNSTFRQSQERPVVSGLGISSSSGGSEAPGPAAGPPGAEAPATSTAPWEKPRPSKKELWRRRLEAEALRARGLQARGSRGNPSSREHRQVSPEMEGLCYKCFEEGHFKQECTNPVVCFRCKKPGHESKDCKRPRSPSPEEDLRRQTAAKVARREADPHTCQAGGPPRAPPPPPPPLPRRAEQAEWPSLCIPRLERAAPEDIMQQEICVVRRTQSTEDLERRLQFAMVAYVGGARHDIRPQFVLQALETVVGIAPEWMSVHHYRPEDFLVVFARQEHRNLVAERPYIEFQGVRLFFRQWNRQAQAVHSELHFKVSLVLEGIPPHAWEREVAEDLLGTSCLVDTVAPESSSRRDLSAFRLTAWTADPEAIPSLRWLAIPEPGLVAPLMQPPLLQYKVLIHLDSVTDYSQWDEPLFLGISSGSEENGVPSDGRISTGGAPNIAPRRRSWRFGVRDSRGAAAPERNTATVAGVGWRLPPMETRAAVSAGGPATKIKDRLSVRVSAFDRLTTKEGPKATTGVIPNSNQNCGQGGSQPISEIEKGPTETSGKAAIEERTVVTAGGAVVPIRDRLSVRVSAFDRLSTHVGVALDAVGLRNSNSGPCNEGTEARQPISDAEADRLIAPACCQSPPEGPTDVLAADALGVVTNDEAIMHMGEEAVEEPIQCPIIEHPQPAPVSVEEPTLLPMIEHLQPVPSMRPDVGSGTKPTDVEQGDKHVEIASQDGLELNANAERGQDAERGLAPGGQESDQEGCATSKPAGGPSTEILGATTDETRDNALPILNEVQSQPMEDNNVLAYNSLHDTLDVTTSRAVTSNLHLEASDLQSRPCTELAMYEREILSEVQDSVQQGMTAPEAIAFAKLKAFCSCIVKKLAPPLLKEIQASSLHPAVEPCTPRRTTRATKRTAGTGASKASPAENVLLRTLGLAAEDLAVDDRAVEELKELFDSPLREQHIRVIAALFGKTLPIGGALAPQDSGIVGAK